MKTAVAIIAVSVIAPFFLMAMAALWVVCMLPERKLV